MLQIKLYIYIYIYIYIYVDKHKIEQKLTWKQTILIILNDGEDDF